MCASQLHHVHDSSKGYLKYMLPRGLCFKCFCNLCHVKTKDSVFNIRQHGLLMIQVESYRMDDSLRNRNLDLVPAFCNNLAHLFILFFKNKFHNATFSLWRW